jgi:5'-methylthioadenosine phosphorylase
MTAGASRKAGLDAVRLLEEIIANVRAATESALTLIRSAVPAAAAPSAVECSCRSALALAIWSDREKIAQDVRDRLAPLLGKYLDQRRSA